MKKLFSLLFTLLVVGQAWGWTSSFQADFSASNNSVTIYYNIVDSPGSDGTPGTVEVSQKSQMALTTGYYYYDNKDVVIPESVTYSGNTYTVTAIGDQALYFTTTGGASSGGLNSVIIPETVTTIGYKIFDGCSNITSVFIPESVVKMGSSGYTVFGSCSSLTSVYIAGTETEMPCNLFSSTVSGCTIYVPKGYQYTDYLNGSNVVEMDYSISPDDDLFTYYITAIGSGDTHNVKLISDDSYAEFTELDLTGVIGSTFDYTSNSIVEGEGDEATYKSFTFKVTKIGDGAFANMPLLEHVIVPWSDPETVDPSTLFAEYETKPLLTINVEDDEISYEALFFNSNWSDYFQIDNFPYVGYTYKGEDGLYYEVTSVGDDGNTVTIVKEDDESYAELTTINIPTEITFNEITFTVTAISESAFSDCEALESVTINTIELIELADDAFKMVEDSDTKPMLYVPEGSERVYAQSTWANYFTIDGYIEGTTFDADGLTYEITDQYEKTAKIVAFDCAESVEIPVTVNDYTVTEIDEYVFTNCSTLKYVTIDATEPPCNASLFANVAEGAVLYVGNNQEVYATASWHDYFVINGYVEKDDTFVVDNIEYEITNITDGYEVQVIGTTATDENTIEFVAEVVFNTFTFDVLNIADNAFDGQTALMAEINIIDPELITLGEIADVSEGKIGKLTVYDGAVNMYNASGWATYFEIAGNEYLEVDSVYYVFKISSNKASSSRNTITLEVDHVDENATEVTIPRTIDLGDNSSTTSYDVTSMNADALKDCKDLTTVNLEAAIPVENIEALNQVPDSVTIVLDEDKLGTEYCESVKAAAAIAGIEVKMVSTAIVEVKIATDKVEVERYNLLGQKVSAPVRGINIIKYSDGTVEKVLIK